MKYLKFISYFFFFLLLMIPVRAFWRNYLLIDEGVSEAIYDLFWLILAGFLYIPYGSLFETYWKSRKKEGK